MSDATSHDILDVPLDEDSIPTEEVPLETIRSGLESDVDMVRHQAATVAAGSAQKDPERLLELQPTLVEALYDDQRVVIYQTLTAMAVLAEHDPETAEPVVDRVVELLDHDLPVIQMLASRVLGLVSLQHPEYLVDHTDTLVAGLADEPTDRVDFDEIPGEEFSFDKWEALKDMNRKEVKRQQIARDITANLLVEVAEEDPASLAPHGDVLVGLLADEPDPIASIVAEIVGIVAKEDPEAVADAVDPLCSLLEREDQTVVANAVTALGFLDDPAAVEPLETVADDEDRDPDLRDLADKTADFVADQ